MMLANQEVGEVPEQDRADPAIATILACQAPSLIILGNFPAFAPVKKPSPSFTRSPLLGPTLMSWPAPVVGVSIGLPNRRGPKPALIAEELQGAEWGYTLPLIC